MVLEVDDLKTLFVSFSLLALALSLLQSAGLQVLVQVLVLARLALAQPLEHVLLGRWFARSALLQVFFCAIGFLKIVILTQGLTLFSRFWYFSYKST